jgi:hydroxymethylpyrimidine/phosphomethylpyrimidine kinase
VRIALSIAGSDPTGGAGLQLDLQVMRALGVHGAGVLTALNVQDTSGVHATLPAFPSVVLDQIRVLLRDLVPHAVKLGQLATDDVARSVALGLSELDAAPRRPPLVIDPVLAASDGTPLLERRAWDRVRELCRGATLVTPNLPEAAALAEHDVSTRAGCEAAARVFVAELGAGAALVKGGHRDGPPDDLLATRQGPGVALSWLPGERIPGAPVRGTGCALASAIAAHLAQDVALEVAVAQARSWLAEAIRRAEPAGKGARLLRF